MDVILTPASPARSEWVLTDRLGRSLGRIHKTDQAETFEIEAKDGTALKGIGVIHPSLDAAMSAIANRMDGACSLDSQDWD